MAVYALQRFGSRSNSAYSKQQPDLVAFRQHARGMSEPFNLPSSAASELSAIHDGDMAPEPSNLASNGSAMSSGHSLGISTPTGSKTPNTGAPPSPGLLSRNESFSNSSSFQEDWEVFPPLDRLTIFDLLGNLSLPQRLEKFQTALSAQTEKVKRQREKIKSSSVNARERVVEEWRRRIPTPDEQLDKYRKRMRESVDRIGARWNDTKAVTLREKLSFIAGVLNIFISGYLVGAHPGHFYYWFTAQLCYFMPIRFYTYHQRGYHYFLADLCYFVNFLLLLSVWVFPKSKRLFISTYCLAYGNNAVAIAMWRNSMVFHSLDKITSLFIHIMPPVTLHCMVHLTPDNLQQTLFPAVYAIRTSPASSPQHYTLLSMMLWASVPYLIWQASYHLLITVRRREKIAAGRPTSFTWLRKSYANTILGKAVLSLPNEMQESAFMLVQYSYALLTMVPCPLWFWYPGPSAGFLLAVFVWSIYNGATFYIDVFGKRFQNELEKLRKDVQKWQINPDAPPGGSPILGGREAVMTPGALSVGAAAMDTDGSVGEGGKAERFDVLPEAAKMERPSPTTLDVEKKVV